MSTLAQDNTPGSVFTVIAAAAFEGSARAVMMSQNQDMFNTIEKSLSFTNNADGNGQATFTLTVPDKDSLFNGNTTDSDTVQITVNKTADNAIIYAAADMTVFTYAVPGQATALTVANGSEFSTITFVSTVGTATNEAITSVNLVCSNGTPAGASAAANQSGGLTFRNIALSTVDAPTDFAATGNAGEYTLKVSPLTDYTYYEAAVQTVSLIGNSPMSATVQLAPSNDMHAPTMSAETLNGDASAVTTSGPAPSFNPNLAQLTCIWSDPDAGSLVTTGATTADSHAILQISTDDFETTNYYASIPLTNAQCAAAATGGVTITQNVAAGTYKSRIHSNSTTSPLNQTGLDSDALQVYVQTAAEMTSPLVSTVTMSTGAQTFAATYKDAIVAGTQVLTMTDDGASLGVGAAVVDGANKTSTSVAVSYANLDGAAIIATLTVQDANSPAISYTYTSATYTTAQFKTAPAPTNLSCETLDSEGAVTVAGPAPTFNQGDAQVTCEFTSADAAQFISSATGSATSYATLNIDGPSSRTQPLTNAECIQAQRLPYRAYIPSSSVTTGASTTGGVSWSAAAFQINLLRNEEVMAYSTESPPSGSTEYWNGARTSGTDGNMASNWIDPQYYTILIDTSEATALAGGMEIFTYDGQPAVREQGVQWTITSPSGWAQTVLRGSVDTSVSGITKLVVKNREYRAWPNDFPVNPQESFTGQMYTEIAAYSFTGAPGDLTVGTALTVEIDTSYTGPTRVGGQLFSAGSVGPSFTTQVTGAGDYVASIVSSQPNQPTGFLAVGDSATQAVLIQTAASITSPLVAAVTMSNGNQTFAATYGVATVAGTQTLTFADDGANLGPTTVVTASGTKSSNSVSYADCADGSIVATLTVQDANSPAILYTYTGTAFTTEQFMNPVAPTATFDINAIGNDNTFKTTLTAINANNGFGDATNMTWQVSTSDSTSGLLSDCSGVYNPIGNGQQEDIVGPTGPNAFVVNDSYYLLVTKTNTYANAGGNYPTSTGVPSEVETAAAYIGDVKYKGNPVVNSIQYTPTSNQATVTVSLNQTTLAATNALTLFTMSNLGTATGNIVHTDVTTVNNPAVLPNTLTETSMLATFQVTLNHNATINTFGIAAVDCDDGHTAIHTHNIPAHADYNSATA